MSHKPHVPGKPNHPNLKQNQALTGPNAEEGATDENEQELPPTEESASSEQAAASPEAPATVAQILKQKRATMPATAALTVVRVTPRRDLLRVRIGKNWYSFKKDMPVSVPESILPHLRSHDII